MFESVLVPWIVFPVVTLAGIALIRLVLASPKPASTHLFKKGWWLRDVHGRLCLVADHGNLMSYLVEYDDGVQVYVHQIYLELAMPKPGEYWQIVPCPHHYGYDDKEPCKSLWYDDWKLFERYAKRRLCGCYVPYNFGKGVKP